MLKDTNIPVQFGVNPPSRVKQFFEKHKHTIIKAAIAGYDVPIYGEASDFTPFEHSEVISDILSGDKEVMSDYADEIAGRDDSDYFRYTYGADGDVFDIEEQFEVDMYDDWMDTAFDINLWDAIHHGFVSRSWLEGAQQLGINLEDKQQIDKINKGYEYIDSLL